jgi:hypothetical protein
LIRFVPWVIGVILVAVAVGAWLESRDQGRFGSFIDRRAGRKIDEAIEETKKDLRDD